MTEPKKLRRLNRAELLELLLAESRETERLKQKLERAEVALTDRNIRIAESGNLANAVLSVNGIMEAAQAAAQQYLENIQRMQQETEERCRVLLEEAQAEAKRIREQAKLEHPTLDQLLSDVHELLQPDGRGTP